MNLDVSDLDPRIQELRDIARTTTLALVVVSVLIASAIAANAPQSGAVPFLRDAALVVLVLALGVSAILILVLVWRAIRGRTPS